MNYLTELLDITIDKITNNKDIDSVIEFMNKLVKKIKSNQNDLHLHCENEILILYLICIEKKAYHLAKILNPILNDIYLNQDDLNFIRIYDNEKKAVAELDYINYLDYTFKLPDFYCNNSYDRSVYMNFNYPLYHLVKNDCYTAAEAYLNKADIFEPLKDKMSYYIKIAAKNHDKKMLKLFADRKYTLTAFDLAYLILYDNEYVNNTIIPMFYNQYSLDSINLYLNIFSDTERLTTYIRHLVYGLFPEEKLIYCRDNMLHISSIDINNVYVSNNSDEPIFHLLSSAYIPHNSVKYSKDKIIINKKFLIPPECCGKTLNIRYTHGKESITIQNDLKKNNLVKISKDFRYIDTFFPKMTEDFVFIENDLLFGLFSPEIEIKKTQI